jgi:CheY-like chemotaxis protein
MWSVCTTWSGNSVQLQQVILNLILNGATAMKNAPPASPSHWTKVQYHSAFRPCKLQSVGKVLFHVSTFSGLPLSWEYPWGRFTVGVVDDDESIQMALKRLLLSEGYHVATFGSAEDFLESLSMPRHGCLVLDICLPGMSGLDLEERLSSSGMRHPVIFMTAHDNPQWQERAKAVGAIAYLRKPFEQHSLLDAVRIALTKRSGSGGKEAALPSQGE